LSKSAAITPEPAPSSRIEPPLTCRRISLHWVARQRLKSEETSGAVTKSPPAPSLVAPAL
jgi:hypothetical protein